MKKRAEKIEKGNKNPTKKIKEIKSKIKEIKVLDSNKENQNKDESLLEKEIEEKDLVFSSPASTITAESNITLHPTSSQQQLEETLPLEQTQFQREDQRNFSQSILYSQKNQYQQHSNQRSYQSSAASAPQERSVDQNEMMQPVQTSMTQRQTQDFVTLIPANEPIVKLRSEIERPRLQREMQESQSRYSYKEKTIDESNTQRRKRDMF